MNRNKCFKIIILSVFLIALLVGCSPGDGANSATNLAGFFTGVWHGWTAPISLVRSIFNRNIRVYEIFNKGISYDFGFYMAIISGFGGLALSRKRN